MKDKTLFIFGLFFLITFIIFTYLVKMKFFGNVDFDTMVKIQNHMPHRFDVGFSFMSLFGSFEVLTLILIIILTALKKKVGVIILGLYLFGLVLEYFSKLYLHHPGPPFMFYRYNLGFIFPSSYLNTGHSYPSGHTFRITFIAALFMTLLYYSKGLKKIEKVPIFAAIVLFVFLMLLSRITLGEHWLTDVIGGFLLGSGLGLISSSLLFLRPRPLS